MATEKTVKRIVAHPRFYMKVDGKLTRIEQGTEVTLTESEAERHGNRLANPGEQKKLAGGKLSAAEAKASDMEKALIAMQKELDAATKRAEAAEAKVAELEKGGK